MGCSSLQVFGEAAVTVHLELQGALASVSAPSELLYVPPEPGQECRHKNPSSTTRRGPTHQGGAARLTFHHNSQALVAANQ